MANYVSDCADVDGAEGFGDDEDGGSHTSAPQPTRPIQEILDTYERMVKMSDMGSRVLHFPARGPRSTRHHVELLHEMESAADWLDEQSVTALGSGCA
jgi:hypothetical protein